MRIFVTESPEYLHGYSVVLPGLSLVIQVTEELNRSHHDSSIPNQAALLRRQERERADLQLELQQLRAERDSLRERLRVSKEGQKQDLEETERRSSELLEQLEEVYVHTPHKVCL